MKFQIFRIFLILFIFAGLIIPQSSNRNDDSFKENLVVFETQIIPADSAYYNLYLSFKISYDKLIFEKNGRRYSSDILIIFDVVNSETKEISRQSFSQIAWADNFEITESRDNYLQGVVNFLLQEGKYVIKSSIDVQNKRLIPPESEISVSDNSEYFLKPFVVDYYDSLNNVLILKNENSIPFSKDKFSLIIPKTKNLSDTVTITISQKDKQVIKLVCKVRYLSNLLIFDDNNKIKTKLEENGKFGLFSITDGLEKLDEGFIKIEISVNDKFLKKYNDFVEWGNKPRSLKDTDFAIKILAKIQGKEEIDKLKENFSGKELLYQYWKKFDPDTATKFNEIMELFYQRVDKAAKEFSTIDERNGALSDRGMIFIKYGQADSIQRSFTKDNFALEYWIYEKLSKKFIFVDKSGLGKFELVL